ncbi:glycerophosphodiester phosphodiesterase [Kribbella shirazensis]|uniref:Glycerophosphoryl diester phosphodiesterase n=1 Tax=Kribbella shirazensis TaxID=1105143 RepID=A0A7X6A501_9ACTN|nr:glycerophosphodiester phosphodiesterase [Kribbella shirazensis]NIK62031.1 glycerophosphoryl diester phosphodiesterase [Kribbella shirazensis]
MTAEPVFRRRATLIGHRGLGKGTVLGQAENTLGSFLAAVEQGLDWVEVDVRRTADDELFVAHDAALPDGTFLADLTAAQVSRLGGLRVRELLDALPSGCGVAFDIKSCLEDADRSPDRTTAALLGRLVRDAGTGRPMVASSFDPAALLHIRAQAPRLALGLLTWLHFPIGHAVAAAAHLDVQVLAAHAGSLWPNPSTAPLDLPSVRHTLELVHRAHRQLLVWCPTYDQATSLVDTGVDALIVDDVPTHLAPAERCVS